VYGIDKPDAERRARLIVDAVKRYAEAERLRAGLEAIRCLSDEMSPADPFPGDPETTLETIARMASEILNPTPDRKESR
jgi:hypothetical protein